MALDVETGHFSKTGTGGNGTTQDVTTGFTPKAIIMWSENETTANEENSDSVDTGYSFGVSDGTNHRCAATASDDGNASGDAHGVLRNNAVWGSIVSGDSNSTRARASIAFGTNKFTMTYDIQSTETTIIHYKIIGGADLTDIEAGTFTTPTSTGTQNVATGVANADFVCVVAMDDRTVPNSTADGYGVSIGFASSSTKRWCISPKIRDGSSSSNIAQGFNTDEIITAMDEDTAATLRLEADFTGFTSSGFDLSWTAVDTGAAQQAFYFTMKGGQWEVGNGSAKTSTGTQAYTTAFQPKGVFIGGQRRTTEGIAREDVVVTLGGAGSTTTEENAGYKSDDAIATQSNGKFGSITLLYRIIDPNTGSTTVQSEAKLDSFNATDFTLDFTTAATAWLFGFFVCGDEAAVAVVRRRRRMVKILG